MEKKRQWYRYALHTGVYLILGGIPLEMVAQEEIKHSIRDSVHMEVGIPMEKSSAAFHKEVLLPDGKLPEISLPKPVNPDSLLHLSIEKPLVAPYYTNPSPLFKGDYNTSGLLKAYTNGAFYGSGRQTTIPGIGQMNEASLGYIHRFNSQWSLQMDANALKMNMPYAVGGAFGISSALIYRPSERIAFKVFGSYQRGQTYGMESHNYGATIKMGITDRFSMEMGVQRYYNPLRGCWETVPVAVPSYKFNKFELGIDVGGILYEILHKVVIGKDGMNMGNPTLAPGMGPLPIRGK